MALGLGWGWVGSAVRERDARASLETISVRVAKQDTVIAQLREQVAVLETEFKMQGQMMLSAQRQLEAKTTEATELTRRLIAIQPTTQNFNVTGDFTTGGDITARDKHTTPPPARQ